jgi:hypothetical protein
MPGYLSAQLNKLDSGGNKFKTTSFTWSTILSFLCARAHGKFRCATCA